MVFCHIANARSNPTSDKWIWYGNDHFDLTQNDEKVSIEMNKKKWECFTLYVANYNLKEYPKLSFDIKTPSKINLRIDAIDQTNRNLTIIPIEKVILASDQFQNVIFEFDKLNDSIDSRNISQFAFFVNAGSDFIGSISINNVQLEITAVDIQTLERDEFKIYPNPAKNSCIFSLSYGEIDQIKISNCYGQVLLTEMYENVNEHEINLEKLSNGFYLVSAFKQGLPVATKRLIIN